MCHFKKWWSVSVKTSDLLLGGDSVCCLITTAVHKESLVRKRRKQSELETSHSYRSPGLEHLPQAASRALVLRRQHSQPEEVTACAGGLSTPDR